MRVQAHNNTHGIYCIPQLGWQPGSNFYRPTVVTQQNSEFVSGNLVLSHQHVHGMHSNLKWTFCIH